MTALSGGGWHRKDGRSPTSPVLERPDATSPGARPAPRSIDQIFPQHGDAARGRELQGTWVTFCKERESSVRDALGGGRTPPEIAYAVGELVHTYFRARGATLTSHELRRLVSELLDQHAPAPPAPAPPEPAPLAPAPPESTPPVPVPPAPAWGDLEGALKSDAKADEKAEAKHDDASRRIETAALVSFAADLTARQPDWTGDAPPKPAPVVPDAVFSAPPSRVVQVSERDAATAEGLLERVLKVARLRLRIAPGDRIGRDEAVRAIDTAIDDVVRGEEETLAAEGRERLASVALSEVCGLGLIDRLWADRGIRAVFINGPDAVFVERNGLMEPSPEVFRDQEHLLEIASRLVQRAATGVAEFQLRDGGSGTVIFPPSAPNGPVVAIRRGEPATATFERLIAADMLDRRIADLLRVAARCRLNVLVSGPSGAGKTSLLVAIARDLGSDARVVTIARHREFRWPAPGKVELVAPPIGHGGADAAGTAGYPALLAAGLQLQPHLLILDSVGRDDEAALMRRLSQGQRGILAAVRSDTTTAVAPQSFDLVVRLARGRDGLFRAVSLEDASGAAVFVHDGGRFHRRTAQPAFAEIAAAAGYRDALAMILR